MYLRFAGTSLILLSVLLTTQAHAAKEVLHELEQEKPLAAWHVFKQDRIHNITVYDTREMNNQQPFFKVEYDVEADMATLARVYFDFSNYPRWYYEAQEAKLLKTVSATEFYYYLIHRAPATLADRDAIIHVTIEPYNAKQGFASVKLEATPDFLPIKAPLVRIPAQELSLRITPISKSKIHVISEGYIDLGGAAPSWATNYVQRQASYLTALAFLRRVKMVQQQGVMDNPAFSLEE
jgi:hypothetical protein